MIKLTYKPDKAEDEIVGPQIKRAQEIIDKYQNQITKNIAISVGGDGTHVYSTLENPNDELLFIRTTGNRSTNYLPDNSIDELEDCLEQIKLGTYILSTVSRLNVKLNGKTVGDCLQDAWIERDSNTIECAINVYDFQEKRNLWNDLTKLDVLVVCNPFGASAYAHSVSFPIMEWDAQAIGIAQVAPSRSLVGRAGYIFPTNIGDRRVTVTLAGWEGEAGKLCTDYGAKINVKHGDTIEFSKSDNTNQIIRINPEPISTKQLRKQEINLIAMHKDLGTITELENLIKVHR